MRSPAHQPTLRGLGADDAEVTDDDIVEIDGGPPPVSARRHAMVTVPPPSRPPRVSGAYSLVPASRRRTLRGNGDA